MDVPLVARRDLVYAGQPVRTGQTFLAESGFDVTLLTVGGYAAEVPEPRPVEAPDVEPTPDQPAPELDPPTDPDLLPPPPVHRKPSRKRPTA